MPKKNKANGYWSFKIYHSRNGWLDEKVNQAWAELSEEEKTEWKDCAKDGQASPRHYASVRCTPESSPKKARLSQSNPDVSSSVDRDSFVYNPNLSREVQFMIDQRKSGQSKKDLQVQNFRKSLPGKTTVEEAKNKPAVFIHMFPLYDGDGKSYDVMQWHPSIIYAARYNLEQGVTEEYHAFLVADDVRFHVQRAQMLNEGRCLVLGGAERMATGPRLPIPGVASSSITGDMFTGWEADYSVIVNKLASLIFGEGSDNGFGNVIFAQPFQTWEGEDKWAIHCAEQELMFRRLVREAKNRCPDKPEAAGTKINIERLEHVDIQPLAYYWSAMHAVKSVEDVEKEEERATAFTDMLPETRLCIGRRQSLLVVKPYMKCEYHATEDNKSCMSAEGRTMLAIMFSDLLPKYVITDSYQHNFLKMEENARAAVRKTERRHLVAAAGSRLLNDVATADQPSGSGQNGKRPNGEML